MRKKKYETSEEQAWEIFDASPFMTLSCKRADGRPYAVALSIARIGKTLYFHCAKEGEKIEGFQIYPEICVSAVSKNVILQEKLTVAYASVIMDGVIEEVIDREEKKEALKAICERYTPDAMHLFQNAVQRSIDMTAIYKIKVQSISGKVK